MGEPINTQPIAPKEKEANLLSSAVPDSLGTERGGRRGRERGERGRERGREGGEGKRERERAPYQHNQRLFPFAFSF